jgi:hypothetical protein
MFLLVVGFYPVVAVVPFILGVFSTPISISYRAGYLLLSLLAILFALLRVKEISLAKGVVPLVLFFILYTIRLYYDLIIRDIRVYESDMYFFQFAVGGTFVPIVAIAVGWSKVNSEIAVKWLYAFSFLSCLAILAMVLSGGGIVETLLESRVRVSNDDKSIVGPIIVSREGGFLANLSLFYLLGQYRVKPARLFLWISLLLGFLLLVVGASRGPLVAAVLILGVQLAIAFWRRLSSVKFWAALVVLFFTVILPGLVYLINFTNFVQNLTIFNRFTNFSVGGFEKETRARQWAASWEQIKSSPVIGERMVENLLGHSPHNLFIEIQLALGIVGSLLFLLTLAFSLKRFYTEFHYRTSFVAVHFMLWLYLLYGLTGISIHTSPQVWLLLAATTYASTAIKQKHLAKI